MQETLELSLMIEGVAPSLVYDAGAATAAVTNKKARIILENMTMD